MSVSDFLFNGSPPPSVTTYGSSTANLPTWYSDFTQGLLAKSDAVAAEPYQPYGAPRVADFTQDQQDAFQQTRNQQGQYDPTLQAGIGTTAGAAGMDALGQAQPYLDNASQSAASTVGNYMNPYNDAVTNRIADLGARNLNENLMPAIGDQFTRAGQYGSTRMQDATGHALRDTQESVLGAQTNALQQGYSGALTAAQNDLTRQGQLGQVAGNLTNTNMANTITAGNQLGNLASTGQSMGLKDSAALSTIGGQEQQLDQTNENTAYQDYQTQLNYPKDQLSFMNNMIRGISVPTSTNTTATAPASTYSASPLASLAGGLGGLSALLKAKGGLVSATAPRRKVKAA